ncbi:MULTISPECIES: hypothetical protein [unclassified Myroides]|uniref:hypothetical protein n=1 Tax=unclassified Myroides TaxID=2642485 RepID=UPI003D2F8F56
MRTTPELPKPFSIEEIQKYPKAVIIAFLIGLLVLFGGMLIGIFYKREDSATDCETEKKQLYGLILKEREDRILLYENMIFYKDKVNTLEQQQTSTDSLYRSKTQQLVNKILR